MSLIDIVRPHIGKPTREIAELTGLTYRQVFDTLVYHGIPRVSLPKDKCRNGHDGPFVFRSGARCEKYRFCRQCHRERWRNYDTRKRLARQALFLRQVSS